MKMFNLALAIALGAGALSATSASAMTYAGTYASGGNPSAASFRITTANVLNAVGGYDIQSIIGSVAGDAFTGMVVNPGQPNPTVSASGVFIYDNVLWTSGAPWFSNPGFLVDLASGGQFNFFSENTSVYHALIYNQGWTGDSTGKLTMGAVPEPASWALMVAGFGLVGGAMRRRVHFVTA